MSLSVIRIRQQLNKNIPAILLFGDVMPYASDNHVLVSLNLSVNLKTVAVIDMCFTTKLLQSVARFHSQIYSRYSLKESRLSRTVNYSD